MPVPTIIPGERAAEIIRDRTAYWVKRAMAVKETKTALPDGASGVVLLFRANNPERFEGRVIGRVVSDDGEGTVEIVLKGDASRVRFEPLTLERWKEMSIIGQDELLAVIPDTETLIAYYWNDWVSDDW